MRRTNVRDNVQLLGVPFYGQGSHDGLCTYYSAAMMLATFCPQHRSEFGESSAEDVADFSIQDPIIKHYKGPMRSGPTMSTREKHRKILSRWFYRGENLKPVANTLNEICSSSPFSTHFTYRELTSSDKTLREIRKNIDVGLPVMLGWDTEDLGCHAVLVVGYWNGKHSWFSLNDPSGMDDVSWDMLKAIKKRRLEVIMCDRHKGPRPDKLVEHKRKGKKDLVTYRWTPDCKYDDLMQMFTPTNVP